MGGVKLDTNTIWYNLLEILLLPQGKKRGMRQLYIYNLVDEQSKQGWEFYRVDTIGVVSKPGCLGSLLGAKETGISYYVATFRKQV